MAGSLLTFPHALREAGVPVYERPGWIGRTTRASERMIQPKGAMLHEDIIPKSVTRARRLDILANGHERLGGPLSQVGQDHAGTWCFVATGRCHHAGAGIWRGVTDGNSTFLAVEQAWYPGEVRPQVQQDSLLLGLAVACEHFGFPPEMICHHKEYATPLGRKTDMHLSPAPIRAQVGLHLLSRAGWPAKPAEGIPTTSRIVYTEEIGMATIARIELTTGLDDKGRGWLPLDGHDGRPLVPWGQLISVEKLGPNPGREGYAWPTPDHAQQDANGVTLLTIEEGAPLGRATLYLHVLVP